MDIIIREAKPADAEELIAYVNRLLDDAEINLELSPGEFNLTVMEEEKILNVYTKSKNSIYLVAEIDSKIVGSLICTGKKRWAVQHVTTLSMSVDKNWRRKGIGTKLLAQAVDWAKNKAGIVRIELLVWEHNEKAIKLYKKFGFEIEGVLRKAVFKNGEYLNDLVMSLILKN